MGNRERVGRTLNNSVTENHNNNISEYTPWITARDLQILATYMVIAPLSWITPERLWRIAGFPIAFLYACLYPRHIRSLIKRIKRVYGTGLKTSSPSLTAIQVLMAALEEHFRYLREHRPGGWRSGIRLLGRDHIEKALEAGQGGILWVGPFLCSNLVVKKGLHQAGFAISHLSTHAHGPSASGSWFGLRFLNPIWIEVYERYLDERIIIPPGDKLGYIRRLERRLRENGLVSINCGPIRDQKRVEQPILNGRIQLATGAPSLALATGATLLPVFTIRRAPGDFEIIVEPPLDLPDVKNRHKAVELLIYKYAKLVESYMVQYPDRFFWSDLVMDEES